jgi:hypothetical protein
MAEKLQMVNGKEEARSHRANAWSSRRVGSQGHGGVVLNPPRKTRPSSKHDKTKRANAWSSHRSQGHGGVVLNPSKKKTHKLGMPLELVLEQGKEMANGQWERGGTTSCQRMEFTSCW